MYFISPLNSNVSLLPSSGCNPILQVHSSQFEFLLGLNCVFLQSVCTFPSAVFLRFFFLPEADTGTNMRQSYSGGF